MANFQVAWGNSSTQKNR